MAASRPPNYKKILELLTDNQVDFIVIGGVCAVLNGVPIMTLDLDIVPSRAPDNLQRLLQALQLIDAHYRHHPKKIVPTISLLAASPGHHLLATDHGPFDVLGTIDDDLDYGDLLPDTYVLKVSESMEVRLLTLEKLIEIKENTGRDKDRAMLPQLRYTLEERQKDQTDDGGSPN